MKYAHLENESVLPWVHRPHEHAVQHLVVLLALRGADIYELPLQVCAENGAGDVCCDGLTNEVISSQGKRRAAR